MNKTKNFKGFVFTIDAIFALVVAAAATTIILYVHFTPQFSYQEPTSEAYGVLQTLLSTSVSQAAVGSSYASYFTLSGNSTASTWPFFGHDAQLSGFTTGYGPGVPRIGWQLKLQTPNIFPQPAVADGLVVVSTNVGYGLFLLNASNGNVVVNTTVGNTFTSFPAIYNHMVGVTNALGGVLLYNEKGAQFSPQSAGLPSLTNNILTAVNNNFIDMGDLANYANGTATATNIGKTSAVPNRYTAFQQGEYIITWEPTASLFASFNAFSLNYGQMTQLWTVNTGGKANITIPSVYAGNLSVGYGANLSVYTLAGKPVLARTFPTAIVAGPASAANTVYVATTNTLYSINIGSNSINFASNILSNNFGSGQTLTRYTSDIALTPTTAYLLMQSSTAGTGTVLEAFSTASGQRLWYTGLNGTEFNRLSGMAIAYGNLYVVVGKTLYAISGCNADPQWSTLQAIATYYVNKEGACANLLLNATYGQGNVGIFINNTYGPAISLANFSQVQLTNFNDPTPNLPTTNTVTVVSWVYPYSKQLAGNYDGIISYGGRGHNNSIVLAMTGTFGPTFSAYYDDYVPATAPRLKQNAWNFFAGTLSGNSVTFYINNQTVSGALSLSNIVYPQSTNLDIGSTDNPGTRLFNGIIAGLQVYNKTLTANQINQLYIEGLAGMPIPNNGLMGWWPLEGDGSDYSGLGNSAAGRGSNGAVPNYVKTSYVPPGLSSAFQVSRATVPMLLNVNGTYRSYNVSVVVWRR